MGNARNLAFWVVLFLLILMLFNLFSGDRSTMATNTRSYSDFVAAVEAGQVSEVTLDGERVVYRGSDGRDYVTIRPNDAEVTKLLIDENIPLRAESQEQSSFTTFILSLLPFLLEGVGGERDLNLADGSHPNVAGHQRMADLVEPVIRAELELLDR